MRFRLLSRERQGPTTDHLALDCQFLPSSTASFLKALIAYLNDQTDPTGLKIYNLREMAKSLRMTYDRIDGLLGILA
ncbi:MAG: hypothetical protein IMW89_22600 [Ktedonobacteraceae bacterium]|nr:hypothetical protein [Ktedonobacteraceae bacterium]